MKTTECVPECVLVFRCAVVFFSCLPLSCVAGFLFLLWTIVDKTLYRRCGISWVSWLLIGKMGGGWEGVGRGCRFSTRFLAVITCWQSFILPLIFWETSNLRSKYKAFLPSFLYYFFAGCRIKYNAWWHIWWVTSSPHEQDCWRMDSNF